MANYTYDDQSKANSWAKCFYRVSPRAGVCAQYTEIHFTEPKEAKANKWARPHVTFIQANRYQTHWYLEPGDGVWTVTGLKNANNASRSTDNALEGEADIAAKVVADMVEKNVIKNPAATTVKATDGGADWGVAVNKKKQAKAWKQ